MNWRHEFLVEKEDYLFIYLWVVKKRSTKKQVSVGFLDEYSAFTWLEKNWKQLIEQEIENILLGEQYAKD